MSAAEKHQFLCKSQICIAFKMGVKVAAFLKSLNCKRAYNLFDKNLVVPEPEAIEAKFYKFTSGLKCLIHSYPANRPRSLGCPTEVIFQDIA